MGSVGANDGSDRNPGGTHVQTGTRPVGGTARRRATTAHLGGRPTHSISVWRQAKNVPCHSVVQGTCRTSASAHTTTARFRRSIALGGPGDWPSPVSPQVVVPPPSLTSSLIRPRSAGYGADHESCAAAYGSAIAVLRGGSRTVARFPTACLDEVNPASEWGVEPGDSHVGFGVGDAVSAPSSIGEIAKQRLRCGDTEGGPGIQS